MAKKTYTIIIKINGKTVEAAPRVPIGRRLRALLEHRGLPHDELRRITGVSESAVSSWMNAHSYPTIEQLVMICDALDVSADVLLGRAPLVLE